MTRAIAKLLEKTEAALREAKRRVRQDPLAGLSPAWRAYVERWEACRSPEDQYAAIREGTHPLSTVNIYPHDEIAANGTPEEVAEAWDQVRDEGKPK
ncbi:hypothetical protein [Paracoccus yeei]|uniref:Uncharacterized protein n=1 Tax=Paracoccus yeei TaxID=147645 RepID=A0A5P2QPM5_9RHOB|nr:hypothetical protein [Paracoccus yeei]QEU07968.1 hypothetical protein FOB51_08085 [Paracoccus yeei]